MPIEFTDVNYFHGRMGAGKSSIAKLADYCLGGRLDPSPALQREFVSAELSIELATTTLTISRPRDSNRVTARWLSGDGERQLSLPARQAAGVVLPGTEVETLSDLIFHLSGIAVPKVRTSRVREDAELRRLSMRDLLWYCYLSQDEIDSTFFHLDKAGHPKQLKSRDVLRFVLGFRGERIAEIEEELERLRGERHALAASIDGLKKVLAEVDANSEADVHRRIDELRASADLITAQLSRIREEAVGATQPAIHEADALRERARALGAQLAALEESKLELAEVLRRERAHLSEVETLTIKFRRSNSAKAVLQGVNFVRCPRCTQSLPPRAHDQCSVCGQLDEVAEPDTSDTALLEQDAKGRIVELRDVIARREHGLAGLDGERHEVLREKSEVEARLAQVLRDYDSFYLSRALGAERERATLVERAGDLEKMLRFFEMVARQEEQIERITGRQSALRAELKEARREAERDASNLDRLKALFLDCLLRTEMPGISPTDHVDLETKDFLPRVSGPDDSDAPVTTFSNISSGGKKTLFKACFAVAVHRLATEIGATLPQLLLIDSPMKNISERENRLQFERFHGMLYELHAQELRETQLILIDKEFFPPPGELEIEMHDRHMQPNEPGEPNPHPPLIPYYTGH